MNVDLISLRFGRARGFAPPLGAHSLRAALQNAGTSCRVVDTQFDGRLHPFAIRAFSELIRECDAPVIALSVFNDAIPLVIAALEHTELRPGQRIVIGGPGVVGIADRLLERSPAINAVVVGEGETALPMLVSNPDAAASFPGVFTRNADDKVRGNGRTPRENLDRLPRIDWNACRTHPYVAVPWSTMRGCPYGCEFCEIIAFLGRRVSSRDTRSAVEDLVAAVDVLGVRKVQVLDDTFTLSKRRVLEICRLLREARLSIEFEIFSRTNTLDEETMEELAAAGCVRVFFGIDAGDDEVLARVTKGILIADAERTLRTAARYFDVTASFIWGYPFESWASFQRMMQLVERLRDYESKYRIWPQIHMLSPSAGTPLFERYAATLVLDPEMEVLPLGSRLDSYVTDADAALVKGVIASDANVAAPFWRYQTPDYRRKSKTVEAFNREHDIEVGSRVLHELEAQELAI